MKWIGLDLAIVPLKQNLLSPSKAGCGLVRRVPSSRCSMILLR